ncbi:MAG: SLBB domain-containing protein [Magnetococcales bacterium]|nr:SLBB domain-containing protein [Magnetococcales bacterium]
MRRLRAVWACNRCFPKARDLPILSGLLFRTALALLPLFLVFSGQSFAASSFSDQLGSNNLLNRLDRINRLMNDKEDDDSSPADTEIPGNGQQPALGGADPKQPKQQPVQRNDEKLNKVHPARPRPQPKKAAAPVKREDNKSGRSGAETEKKNRQEKEEALLKDARENELTQFGYDFFANQPSTFSQSRSMPIPNDYVIGPDDVLQVNVTGKEIKNYNLRVNRDGIINLTGIGPVSVGGLPFKEVRTILENLVETRFIGMKLAHLSISALRSIQVFLTGETQQPGAFTVSALSTVTNALSASGGVKPRGSLRKIELRREGQVIATLDLYNLLLKGDKSGDLRLQGGDVLFIPRRGATVGLAGEVRSPGIYELNGEKTVGDVVKLAGGLLPTAYANDFELERIQPGKGRVMVPTPSGMDPFMALKVMDGDTVRFHPVQDKTLETVALIGHAEQEGIHQWKPGMRLVDLLPSRELLQPDADLDYVLIMRFNKATMRSEVMATRLGLAWANRNSSHNPALQPQDEILVFGLHEDRAATLVPYLNRLRRQTGSAELEPVISVRGHVRFPGDYPFVPGMRLSDLVHATANIRSGTDLDYALLTRVVDKDGRIAPVSVRLRDVLGGEGSPADLPLQGEDQLLIFPSSQFFEEQRNLEERDGVFSRKLELPGQGGFREAFPGESLEVKQKAASQAGYGFNANLQQFHYSGQPADNKVPTAPGAPTLFGNNSSSRKPGTSVTRLGPNPTLPDLLAASSLSKSQEEGTAARRQAASMPGLFPQAGKTDGKDGDLEGKEKEKGGEEGLVDFETYFRNERFRKFRHAVGDLPALMTGSVSETKLDKFEFLNVPPNSKELTDHYRQWSRYTREGLLAPVIEKLTSQATIFEPSRIVQVAGMVRFPGKYPLEEGMRISDLVRAGGQMSEPAYGLEGEVSRYSVNPQGEREIVHHKINLARILTGDVGADMALQPFDTLSVKVTPEWSEVRMVSIQGEVRFPGVYPVRKGETLINLMERAGGLTSYAYPAGAIFLRENLKERERQEMAALADRVEMSIVKAASTVSGENQGRIDPNMVIGLAKKLRETEPHGRLAIDLPEILSGKQPGGQATLVSTLLGKGGEQDVPQVTLRDGDRLLIPQRSDEVTVFGEVYYPTSHQFIPGRNAEEYVDMSGGFTSMADKKNVYVVKANGRVIPRHTQNTFGVNWFQLGSQDVGPGDAVVVPLYLEPTWTMVGMMKEVTGILYNISVTLAAIHAVGAI